MICGAVDVVAFDGLVVAATGCDDDGGVGRVASTAACDGALQCLMQTQ